MKKKIILSLALVAILVAPSKAIAGDVVVPYENLVSVLSGYHGIPEADYWQNLEAEYTLGALMKIAEDATLIIAIRARALSAMSYFENQSTREFVLSKSAEANLPYLRAAAYEALARLDLESKEKVLGKGLYDEAIIVRVSAMRALKNTDTPEARLHLLKALASERNSTAKAILEKAIEGMPE